jgi:PKHD-type hydroxylase
MLLQLSQVLNPDEIRQARSTLAKAPWGDGRITAGSQSALAKNNEQLPEECAESQRVRAMVLSGLQRHQTFFSAALPKHISPPLFNRYGGAANSFGSHVDSAVRYLSHGGGRIRTDISCTLFLADPDEYDGGELVIEDTYGEQRVKFAAGDVVMYPGTSVHCVSPVTSGYRMGAYFWVQSMIRGDEQRRLLFEMDKQLMSLRSRLGETDPAIIGLTGGYHNLLRMWLDV